MSAAAPDAAASAPDDALAQAPATRIYSMQGRLLAVILLFLAMVWAAVILGTYTQNKREVGQLLDVHLQQTAGMLASQPVDEIRGYELDERDYNHDDDRRKGRKYEGKHEGKRESRYERYRVPMIFQVWKQDALLLTSTGAPRIDLRDGEADDNGFAVVKTGGTRWRTYTTSGRDDDVQIVVAENIQARKKIVTASVETLLYSLLLAFPLIALFIWWSLRRAMRPLHALGGQIQARSLLSLQALRIDRMPREIQPLVDALNQLFVRMGDMLQSERRFTADAAHELRTPIAAIRMMAQVAQGSQHDAERQQALQGVLQGCDRATRLVEQLLQLARLESDTASSGAQSDAAKAGADAAAPDGHALVNILPALEQVVQDMRHTLAQPRQQTLQWQAPATLEARMAPTLAAVLLRNLLDNALRYSDAGATVRARVHATPNGGMQWVVQDSGPGMEPEAMAQLGQRFFRVLGTGQSGSGLGWSIVRRITSLYGLHVAVDRSPDLGGLRVRISTQAAAA